MTVRDAAQNLAIHSFETGFALRTCLGLIAGEAVRNIAQNASVVGRKGVIGITAGAYS